MFCDNKVLCSPKEAMAALGVSQATIYRLLDKGALKSVKIGKARRIQVRSILHLIENGTHETV